MKLRVFDRILRRGDKMNPEMRNAIVLAQVTGESQKSDAEINWREQLGTNFEILHDLPVEEVLTEEMYYKLLYQDAQGGWKVGRGDINYDMAALRMIMSHVNRASFLSPKEASIIKIKLRAMFKRIKLQSRPDTYNLGFVNFLKAAEIDVLFLLNDAIEGRKGRLLKTIPKVTTLNVEGQQFAGTKAQ